MENLKILIVEDDRSTQVLYKHGFRDQPFEIFLADTGKAALAVYLESRPDIIILDLGLPDIDGILILKKIREEVNDISTTIIVASSLSDRENVVQCMKFGINGFLVKPIDAKTLLEKVLESHKRREKANISINPDVVSEMINYNWSDIDDIEKYTRKIPLKTGIEIFINIEGVEFRLKSFITGVHHGQYLLIQCPKMTTIDIKLYEGNAVRVVYMYSGIVCSFRSTILNFIKNPSRLIFLSYPESVAINELRKDNRVNCSLKTSVTAPDHEMECTGTILDISMKGCKFEAAVLAQSFVSLQLGDKLLLALELTGSKETISFTGELRNFKQEGSRMTMGIEFDQFSDESTTVAEKFSRILMEIT